MNVVIQRIAADEVLLLDGDSGEVIDLTEASVEQLAEARYALVREDEDRNMAKAALDAAIHDAMDRENTLTLRAGRFIVTGRKATATEWDIDGLKNVLADIVAHGQLSEDAALKALEPVTQYKPRARQLAALADRFPSVATCRVEVPQRRYAKVEEVGS